MNYMFREPVSRQFRENADGSYMYKQEFSVNYAYPVYFTQKVFAPGNKTLVSVLTSSAGLPSAAGRPKVIVYIDSGVAEHQPALSRDIQLYFAAYADRLQLVRAPEPVPGGEQAKNSPQHLRKILDTMAKYHLDRQSFVVVAGGGSVLDMVGFAAAIFHRGIRLVRLPSTVLAQNDAGVGVKNGLNGQGIKNFVGSFAPPYAVINDITFLTTLADRDWRGGIAEAVKVALIKDRDFFDFLCQKAAALNLRELAAMESLIRRCAVLHLEHIRTQGDPFEYGSSRPLDFGHWSGHRLEVLSRYQVGHGQAVAIGMALDSYYAMMKGYISESELERILSCLEQCGLPCWHPLLADRSTDGSYSILAGLEQFREHLGGRLCVTLPGPLGQQNEVTELDHQVVGAGIDYLKMRYQG